MKLSDKIKQDIQQGHWPSGLVLKQTELAEFYQVSRIPVRDAIAQLLNQGWLVPHGKAGIAVANFDQTEIEDLYLMRMRLEPLLLDYAAPNLTFAQLGQAEDILLQADSCTNASEIGELNWQFHLSLYQAAKRPTLFDTVCQLHQKCGRYIGYQSVSLNYLNHSQQEHRKMLALLRSGDSAKACELLAEHIRQAGQALIRYLQPN